MFLNHYKTSMTKASVAFEHGRLAWHGTKKISKKRRSDI